ncbi:protein DETOXIFICATION 18-like isoform X2 [Solanum verrucosum]|uniref:protein DETOXIFICATION 18-like isoform X2 n=1 Tax=Solanum verrucosum TaxID=315347 RepID=UPI0020D1B60F|nr:protein DETOXIFICATION 18-like isoform X2 [Solanum verrucosum]
MYKMLGIHLQISCIISFIFSTIIAISWWYSDKILILLHQDPDIAKEAGVFLKFLIPGLFAYGFLQNFLVFLQSQSIVMPLVVCSMVSLVLHIGITYCLVYWTSLGFKGAPLAASISIWISVIMLVVYVFCSKKKFSQIWREGLSFVSFHHIFTNLKLSLPSAAMICLEYWDHEFFVLSAGLMPNSETTTSLIAMSVNTEAVAFMVSYGLSAAASAWAGFFSDSTEIIKEFATMMPLLLISFVLDFFQGILSGVARGCGWQHLVMFINLATFYFIGMPISWLLAFKFNLHAQGLWMGSICGLACQALGLLLLTLLTKWEKMEDSTKSNRENELLA